MATRDPTELLDQGAVQKINNNQSVLNPKFQILQIKQLTNNSNQKRSRLLLSDSKNLIQAVIKHELINLSSNHLPPNKLELSLKKHAIIKLNGYETKRIFEKTVIIILSFEIIQHFDAQIGNPSNRDQKSPQSSINSGSSALIQMTPFPTNNRAKSPKTWKNNDCPINIAKKILSIHLREIPNSYFDPQFNRCYCSQCHSKRCRPQNNTNSNSNNKNNRNTPKTYNFAGKPSKKYSLPLGFTRIGLETSTAKWEMNNIDDWNIAYHGCSKYDVVNILKSGLLLKPGDVTINGQELNPNSFHTQHPYKRYNEYQRKYELFDPNQIFITPSIEYAARYSAKFYCPHPEIKENGGSNLSELCVQFVLQLRVRPNCYEIGQETLGASHDKEIIDLNFNNDELEWYTKENVGIMPYAILMKITECQDIKIESDYDSETDSNRIMKHRKRDRERRRYSDDDTSGYDSYYDDRSVDSRSSSICTAATRGDRAHYDSIGFPRTLRPKCCPLFSRKNERETHPKATYRHHPFKKRSRSRSPRGHRTRDRERDRNKAKTVVTSLSN